MSIAVHDLNYTHEDGEVLFRNISFTINKGEKVSIVGNNGTGKSTLLQILSGQRKQQCGDINTSEAPYYIPQHVGQFDSKPISEALKIKDKIDALRRILEGDASEENLATLGEDWEIEERTRNAFRFWGIEHLDLTQEMGSLSGGEKTKVFLAGMQIHSPMLILLDEPSNHLDISGRRLLYDVLRKCKMTILLVSHDRELLSLTDSTIELTRDSANAYGGNYAFYKELKKTEQETLHAQLAEKEKVLRKARQNAREVAEQSQKRDAKGKAHKQKAGIPRIILGGLKNKAEQSSAKLKTEQTCKISTASNERNQIKEQLRNQHALAIDIHGSNLHQGKIIVKAEKINYSYGEHSLWEKPLSFQLTSGDRTEITGNNGSGKTTLMRILSKELLIASGTLHIADCTQLYIDQEYSVINNGLTVLEQVQTFNDRCLTEQQLKDHLHHHRFPYACWDRISGSLSGGEKMKLVLCCMAVSNNLPDVIMLDEPTNNLDLYSQDILTAAIKDFKGTVLVISHDKHFISKIDVKNHIPL